MADVFISYKRDERQAVERLASKLRELRLNVWFDASMSAGDTFNAEIDREARAAKAILVCWSPAARESRWVIAEAMIGFEQNKLAACHLAGPDAFSPPTPFNTSHAEDLRAWVAAPSDAHAGWRSVLRRIGRLCGRADIESWGALDAQASADELRAWIGAHQHSPLFVPVEAMLRDRETQDAERARLENAARERQARDDAERRLRAEAEHKVREEAARRAEIERAARAQREAKERLSAAKAESSLRSARRLALWTFGAVALVALLIWSPWNDRPAPPVAPGSGADIAGQFSASLPASLPNGFNRTHLQAHNDRGVRVEALYRLGERDLWIAIANTAAAAQLVARSPSMPLARTERESLEQSAIGGFYQGMERSLGRHDYEGAHVVNTEIDGRVHSIGDLPGYGGQVSYAIIGRGVAIVAVFDRGATEEDARAVATSIGIERLEQVVRDTGAGQRQASPR